MQFVRNLSVTLGLFLVLSISDVSISDVSIISDVNAQVVRYSVDGGPTVEEPLPAYQHPQDPFGKKFWRGNFEGDGFILKANPALTYNNLGMQTMGNQNAPGSMQQTSILWIHNTSSVPKHFNVEVSVPLPMAVEATAIDGSIAIKYTVYGPETSGYLTCSENAQAAGNGLVQASSDGISTNMLGCPFNMGSTLAGGAGSTTSGTTAILNLPEIGPSAGVSLAGIRKDSLSVKFNIKVDPTDTFFVSGATLVLFGSPICLGDQNMDDNVDGSDFGLILNQWGLPPADPLQNPAQEDVVGINDLSIALGSFGNCTEN